MGSSLALLLLVLTGCEKEELTIHHGDVQVSVEKGENWIHKFDAGLISVKNSPQMAIWVEDLDGNYLTTVYVTKKIATQGWVSSGGNRRKEALPHWCYSRGVQYEDGLYLPTKKSPLPDAVTGATPKSSFSKVLSDGSLPPKYIVKMEVNHSTDFNANFPKDAKEGSDAYSGGPEGSGQPALVYSAVIDTTSNQICYSLTLVGHSSADGSDGEIYTDCTTLTTAMSIVKSITVILH